MRSVWILFFTCFWTENASQSFSNSTFGPADASGNEVCMEELGCFGIPSDFFHIVHRPIRTLPQDRVTINTRSFLYTRHNPKEGHQLIFRDPASFHDSRLEPSAPTKLIVHGYLDSELYGPWMLKMKDELLLNAAMNVVIVDWSGGNQGPYFQATANARVVGAEVGLVLSGLQKYLNVRMENCHLIGHSLGAHIAGYAGKAVKGVGRITALDPAEPYFQLMPATVRIDATDARYVDVIHTDATNVRFIGFGMSQLVGHVDFFPNNGRKQPGCSLKRLKIFITEGLNEGLRRFASCNHQRALDFMHYTINYKKVVPVAYECPSWQLFLEGKCAECGSDGSRCAILGMRADEYRPPHAPTPHAPTPFYLKTDEAAPFWLYHYQVAMKLYKPKPSFKDPSGTITVDLVGARNKLTAKLQDKVEVLYHGSRSQYLVTTDKELGDIQSVVVTWSDFSWNPITIFSKPVIHVEYITITPMNVIEKSPRNMTDRVFCDDRAIGIKPRGKKTLLRQNACLKFL